jgi:hypothetical protein
MQRLENIVKKHDGFQIYSTYAVVIVSLFVAVSALVCLFLKDVVTVGSSKPITMEVSADCFTDLCHSLI